MLKIQGTLRTTTPLTVAQPGDLKITLTGRRSPAGFPCTEVARMPLPGNEELAPASVPVIPANTLRGGLRRAGAALIERALIARGEKLELAALHSLRSGTPYGHPDKAAPNLIEIATAQATPPLGVFGGGPRMIGGALRVDAGMPIIPETLDRALVPLNLSGKKVEGRLSTFFWLRRADDVVTFVDHTNAQHVVKDYSESLDAWQVLVGGAQNEDQVDEEPADDSTFRKIAGFNAFEAVLPGVPFAVRYDLDTDHTANAGFLLLALQEFARTQRVGGMGRLGHGRFTLDLHVQLDEDPNTVALFVRAQDSYELNLDDPRIDTMVKAALEWLDQVTAAQLHALLLPSVSSRTDVRKKLKGSARMQEAFDRIYGVES